MGETTQRIRSSGGAATEIAVDGPQLIALCDGYLDVDLSRFPDVVRGVGDDLAIADGQDLDDMTVSVNAFLIVDGGRLCLVDAGDGSRRGASLGHLRPAIKAAGYDPQDVTHILMTHLHGDHAAGLVEGGQALFPEALLYVSEEEQRFWRDPSRHDEIQATQAPFAEAAMTLYAERIQTIRPGDEALPGVSVEALPGHTPGQVGFRIGDESPVLIAADTLHLPALQVKHPEWGFLFDADRAQAFDTRVALMERFAGTNLRLAGAHIPYPGVIRILRNENGLDYERSD